MGTMTNSRVAPETSTTHKKPRKKASLASMRARDNPTHQKIIGCIDGKKTSIFMTAFTVYALFGDDLRLGFFSPSTDPVFFVLSIIALIAFSVELLLNSIAKKGFFGRFYFWLDLLATLSLVPDIGWIWDPIVGNTGSSAEASSTAAIQAGKASRAGTKAGRIVRIVRLVRLIRIVKLYKHVGGKGGEQSDKSKTNEPSMVGKELADLTTRRLIIIVLSMVIVLPFLSPGALGDNENQYQTLGLSSLHRMRFTESSEAVFLTSLRAYVGESGDLLNLVVHNATDATVDAWLQNLTFLNEDFSTTKISPSTQWEYSNLHTLAQIEENLRENEVTSMVAAGCYDSMGTLLATDASLCQSRAVFSTKSATQEEAYLNIAKTLFIMVVLAAGAFTLTKITETLVIGPIERMVNLVKNLAKDPLASVHHTPSNTKQGFETALLEQTLAKIGGLLQIGFGEAGTEIIRQNMMGGGQLNPLVAGVKMTGIFGFCDIRQFTDATECLQEEVMVFVNRIGSIVHYATHQYSGAANKNIGDAFLLVWRIPDEMNPDNATSVVSDHPPDNMSARPVQPFLPNSDVYASIVIGDSKEVHFDSGDTPANLTEYADCALYAFLKCTVDISNSNNSGQLHRYHNDPRLADRFPGGYSVKMGYGLHMGWAIEGAIGSKLKIDASYLSSNVNMSSRLEAATKQYGAPLLMSGDFTQHLSRAAKQRIRKLDRVTVKGSNHPIELYTFDVTDIPARLGVSARNGRSVPRFATDPHVPQLQGSLHPSFLRTFGQAVEAYLDGSWGKAKELLDEAEGMKEDDGPSATLRRVMGPSYEAPADWPGYRALTEK